MAADYHPERKFMLFRNLRYCCLQDTVGNSGMSTQSQPPQQSIDQTETFDVWEHKPWWCQPWSILLTGNGAIAGSWLLFHRYWLTGLVAIPLGAWMVFFVLLYPKLVAEAIATEKQSAK